MLKRIPAILFFLICVSCQTEQSVVNQVPGNRLVADSNLENLISRVSQNATGFDNIVDNTNCFAINLPFTVVVNQQAVYVDSAQDYQAIEGILQASSTDDDSISIQFPVTVSYADFTSAVVYNQQEFDAAAVSCGLSISTFSEISCIDFAFPITLNTYDSDNQAAGSISILSNQQLFAFIAALSVDDIVSIAYPISMIGTDGELTVNSNAELESAIEDAIGTCGDPISVPTLNAVAIDGTWIVSYYYHNQDETSQYNGYTFTFSPTGVVTAVQNGDSFNGTWQVHQQGSQLMMDIDFNNSDLGDLDDDWRVLEYSETQIRLRQDNGGSDGDRLYFSKI